MESLDSYVEGDLLTREACDDEQDGRMVEKAGVKALVAERKRKGLERPYSLIPNCVTAFLVVQL